MNLVEKALEIATKAHENQFRRDKITPYITHPIAVSGIVTRYVRSNKVEIGEKLNSLIYWARMECLAFGIHSKQFSEILEIVSISHDLEEDCAEKGFTINSFIFELQKYSSGDSYYSPIFFLIIKKSLEALTHRIGDSYLDYILTAKKDRIARIIKLGDIEHNISTRNGSNTAGEIEKDKLAIEKYELARHILLN